MLIHKLPLVARATGLSSEYEYFLNFGMRSTDPEVLVAAGEALILGNGLARNVRQGFRFFAKANNLSPFMGAFMIARLDVLQRRPITKRMLQKAASAGHVPSALLLERLRHRKVRKYMFILTLPSFLMFALKCKKLLLSGLKDKENLYARFWRYKDIGMEIDKELSRAVPVDRAHPFRDIEEALFEE
ncbi:hypothetical protein DIE11_17360 [Burkholderia sp. Bp9012]|nr:hypothetical protein DIE11_17360 [Burkholderia sp. Bp9012]